MNQNQFYNFHPDKISVVAMESLIGRSSSLFFYCLLDGHPELISNFVVGEIYLSKLKNNNQIINCVYRTLRDSHFCQTTTYNFPFSISDFSVPFQMYIDEFGISNKNIFIATHYALAVLLKKDISKVKWIILHTHGATEQILKVKADFPNEKLMLSVRDPRASMWAHHKRAENVPIFSGMLASYPKITNYKKVYGSENILYIKHEELHTEYSNVRKNICKFLSIEDNNSFDNATLFNQMWDGSTGSKEKFKRRETSLSTSGLCSSKPDSRFVSDEWKENLGKLDLFIINILGGQQMIRDLNYPEFETKKIFGTYKPLGYIPRLKRVFALFPEKTQNRIIEWYLFLEKNMMFSFMFQSVAHFLAFIVGITRFTRSTYYFKKYLLKYYFDQVIKTKQS